MVRDTFTGLRKPYVVKSNISSLPRSHYSELMVLSWMDINLTKNFIIITKLFSLASSTARRKTPRLHPFLSDRPWKTYLVSREITKTYLSSSDMKPSKPYGGKFQKVSETLKRKVTVRVNCSKKYCLSALLVRGRRYIIYFQKCVQMVCKFSREEKQVRSFFPLLFITIRESANLYRQG